MTAENEKRWHRMPSIPESEGSADAVVPAAMGEHSGPEKLRSLLGVVEVKQYQPFSLHGACLSLVNAAHERNRGRKLLAGASICPLSSFCAGPHIKPIFMCTPMLWSGSHPSQPPGPSREQRSPFRGGGPLGLPGPAPGVCQLMEIKRRRGKSHEPANGPCNPLSSLPLAPLPA
jgi:hypothetical protein